MTTVPENPIVDLPLPVAASPTPSMAERPVVRFGATFIANATRAGLSFLAGIIVARSLGASRFGDLSFLLSSFAAVAQLLDAGTSPAFYTLLSRRRRGVSFFLLYATWTVGVQFGGTMLFLATVAPDSFIQGVWLSHDRGLVLLSFAASFSISQIWGGVSQMGEALRKTVAVQLTATAQAALHVALIGFLAWRGALSVPLILGLLAFEYAAAASLLAPRFIRSNLDDTARDRLAENIREFIVYCRPLVLYAFVGFAYAFVDRWVLQRFGGSTQQGFFSIGQQFANVSLLAVTSIVNVFWKEVAEANERGDRQRLKLLYGKVRRALYVSSAAISCLLIPYSGEILSWTVGSSYRGAQLCLALMFLYPVHQALGHVQGTFYLAVGATRTYSYMGLAFMLLSIPATYLMLAPRTASIPGLGLGAVGLALKLVVLQILGIAAQMVLIARQYDLGYDFGFQAAVLGGFLGLGWATKFAAAALLRSLGLGAAPVEAAVLGAVLYAFLTVAVLYREPALIGFTPSSLREIVRMRPFRS